MPLFPVASSVYINPARQVDRERLAEEQEIRRHYTAQLAESEKQARANFEADMKAKKDAARAAFESGLTAEKNKSTFESDLSSQEAAARSQFESQLTAQRTGFIEAPLRVAKREYAMRYGKQMVPRLYRAAKAGREEAFSSLGEVQKEAMEEQLTQWKTGETEKQKQAVKEWESSELSTFEGELQAWEKEQRALAETELSSQKAEVQAAFEPELQKWRETWQPKGLAERMMEIKIPSLNLGGKLSDVLGLSPKAVGKLVLSPEGFKVPKTEFAPLAAPAGMVASVESLVYSVGQLAGIKTPRIPPTVTGGLVGSGFESIMGGRLAASPELQQIVGMESAYGAGTLLGEVLLSYGIGKAAQKIVIEPLSGTRLGKYVGYQFKVHAPKSVLRAVYGKSGAEYIVAERSPFYEGALESVAPSGETVFGKWKIPKSREELDLSRELLGGADESFKVWTPQGYKTMIPEAELVEDFPLKVTRGTKITPFKKTLEKALGDTAKRLKESSRGSMQFLAPLETAEKILRPQLPALAAELQFGFTPVSAGIPVMAGLGTALGIKIATATREKALEVSAVKPAQRLGTREALISASSLAEAIGVKPWQELKPALGVGQAQGLVQPQLLNLQLKLKLKLKLKQEALLKKQKKKGKPHELGMGMAGYLYPILPVEKLPKFLLGRVPAKRQSKSMSASSFILGKRGSQNVFKHKVRHKRK